MIAIKRFVVIDPDPARRGRLAHGLTKRGWRAEPFDDPHELNGCWPNHAAVLVANTDNRLADLLNVTNDIEKMYPILAYSERPEPSEIVDAVLMGALDYLKWPFSIETLVNRLPILEDRYLEIGRARLKELRARNRISRLSRRERQVLAGIVEGYSNRGIAAELAISPRTVEIHRANMMRKIGAQNVAEAVKLMLDSGDDLGDRQAA